MIKGRSLKRYNVGLGIKWRHNLSQVPWCGGLFEHFSCFVEKCLIKSTMKMMLTYKEHNTVTSQVKVLVNSKTLTYIYQNKVKEVIAPIHPDCGKRYLDEYNQASSMKSCN